MTNQNANEVVVGANGQIYVAATTVAGPTAVDSVLDVGFTELGFMSEEGAKISDAKTVEAIGAWQSFYAIRRIVTAREFSVSFALRQWNRENVPFALGGGLVTGTPGDYKYTPPGPSVIDERSLVLDWQDGTKNFRLYIPRGMTQDSVESALMRTAAADLPIVFSVLSDGVTDPYSLFTDDPAFASGS